MASLLRTEPSPGRSSANRVGDWWLVAVAALVGAIALVGLPARATYSARTTADEPQYLLSAISLAEDFDLDISDELRSERYRPFHEVTLDQQTIGLDDSGRQVSPHDPLLPLLLALPMAIGGWVGAKLALAAIAAATAALTAALAQRRYDVAPSTAAIATVSCFAGLPLAGYGTQVYPEMPAAFLTLVMVAGLTTPSADRRSATLTMVSLIAIPWLAVKYVPVAAVGGIALLWQLRQRPTWLAWTTLGAAVGAVTYLVAHQWVFGGWTVYAAGDHFISTGEFSAVGTNVSLLGRSRRLIGLIVDRDFGIAAWSPVWFLLPIAAAKAWVDRSAASMLLIWLLVATWLNATFVALTMHGWWMPGRQLVVALPIGILLIAHWANASRNRTRILTLLGFIGLFNWLWLALEGSTGRRTLIVDFDQTASWPYRAIAPLLPDGLTGGNRNDLLLVAWLATVGVISAIAHRVRAPDPGDATDG
jgi:hypothetical protein